MTSYTLSRELAQPYGAAVNAVRAGLAEQGFGVLTEIDLKATLKAKSTSTRHPRSSWARAVPRLPTGR